MPTITLNIPGSPLAQKRHRHVKTGAFIQTYDPSSDDKAVFLYKALAHKRPEELILGGISMDIIFYMPRPKSHYRTGKNSHLLKDNAPNVHINKPDIDNLEKFLKDSLTGIYYKDDSQIYELHAIKLYSETPETIITINYER